MKRLIFLIAVSLLFLFPQLSYAVGGVEGVGAPIPRGRVGGETFIRYIGDRLILDFHEGAGTTVRDLSGNGNHGTFGAGAAAPTWERSRVSFGLGDYLNCGSDSTLYLSNYLSFGCSIEFDVVSGDQQFMVKAVGSGTREWLAAMEATTPHYFRALVGDAAGNWAIDLQSKFLLVAAQQYSVMVTVDNMGRIYVNGDEKKSLAYTDTIKDAGEDVSIGTTFDGSISFVRINATAFSANQVLAEYLWNKWRN